MKTRILLFLVPAAIFLSQAAAMASANLSEAWSSLYDAGQSEKAHALEPTADSNYVYAAQGGLSSNLTHLVKTSADGETLWVANHPGSPNDIQATSDGGYIVVGVDSYKGFLQKVDSDGTHQWRRDFSRFGYTTIFQAVEQTADGGFVVCGHRRMSNYITQIIMLKTDPSGSTEWIKILTDFDRFQGLNAAGQTSDGGYIFAGETALLNGDKGDGLVIKTDAAGQVEWQKILGDEAHQSFEDLHVGEDGSFILVGMNNMGDEGSWLVRLNDAGELVWQTNQPEGWLFSVEPTADAGYILAGEAADSVWLVKTDAEGNTRWQESFSKGTYDSARDARQTAEGGYIVAGTSRRADVYGGQDALIAKFDHQDTLSSPQGAAEMIGEMLTSGEIDNGGIANHVENDLTEALYLIENGNVKRAQKILGSLLNFLRAQAGKHISEEAADLLEESIESILAAQE